MKKYALLLLFFALPALAEHSVMIQELPLEAPSHSDEIQNSELSFSSAKEQNLDDLYSLLDAQNTVVQDLTNKIEQMDFKIQQLTQKLEKTNQDVDFRLKELENKPMAQPVVIDKSSDKERYDFAYNYIKQGNYDEAQKLLSEFTKDFSSSSLIPNALYWLGETYYVKGEYETAVGFFADVFTKHKTSTKAPDALFKMGLSMKSLNNKDAACSAWNGLLSEYPKAEATVKKRAQEEIKKLKCSN